MDFVNTFNEGEARGIGTAALQALMQAVPVPAFIADLGLRVSNDVMAIAGQTVRRTVQLAFGPSETADATFGINANGQIVSVTLGVIGNDYIRPPIVTVNPGAGGFSKNALLRAFLSVRLVAVDDGGSGFGPGTTAQFIGGLPPANLVINSGCVRRVTLVKPGLGYVAGTTVSFEGGGANGSTPPLPARATITRDAFGRITSITLIDMGSGYVQPPEVRFHPPAGVQPLKLAKAGVAMAEGTPARATVVLAGDVIAAINITNTGRGYVAVPDILITGAGTGAVVRARMRVERVDVKSGGLGYTATALAVFTPFFKSIVPDAANQARPFFRFMEQLLKQEARTPMRSLTPTLA